MRPDHKEHILHKTAIKVRDSDKDI